MKQTDQFGHIGPLTERGHFGFDALPTDFADPLTPTECWWSHGTFYLLDSYSACNGEK